ncbi:MAG: (d)CMP kinase [Betaproteobacteria bacterium]|nr:(d)CMP kinase [Betaproteobacteria bacterium]
MTPDDLPPVITIDGPTASGKGTVAYRVAKRLGYHYLDSGALYRLTALRALQQGVDLQDEEGVAHLAKTLDVVFADEHVFLEGCDVSDDLRSEKVGQCASQVAAYPKVRQALFQRQRDFRQPPGLVCDGRDMGSVIFPDAKLKIFLTASVDARAERRVKQLIQKGIPATLANVVRELAIRDERDANRPVAPLVCLDDSFSIDTTHITADEAVEKILHWYALSTALSQ